MSLVRWFRKNNTKVMAVVVIVLMVGFIGGSSIPYLLRGKGNINKAAAYFGDKEVIKGYDVMNAQEELDILEKLQAGTILRAIPDPIEQTPLMQALMLGELLFSESRPTREVVSYFEQASGRYQFRINKKQINDLYERKIPNYFYWFLLDKEAQNGGYKVPNETSRELLSQALPQLTGLYYAQFMANMMKNTSLSEDKILSVFSKLLAVLQYSHTICTGQDITLKQLKSLAASQVESVDIEIVKVNAEKFIDKLNEPAEQQISEQFEKFKNYSLDEITDENPYGFGYKLPNRVQLEYMAVKLDDIKEIIKQPTYEELSDFYTTNKNEAFKEQVKANPTDPNSDYIERIKPYSEVEDDIKDYLVQQKTNQKAEAILMEAKGLVDGNLPDFNDVELEDIDIEGRKELTGDFSDIAQELSEKYNVKIYQDVTGYLSADDMQTDKLISQLYVEGYINTLSLAKVSFSIEQFDMNILGIYETVKPKMYMSVGPVKDQSANGKIMAITRVVKAINSSIPESVNQTYSKKPIVLDPNEEDKEEYTFIVKDNVIKDIKCIEAMDIAKDKANEFLELAATQEDELWENAIDKFNELYEQEYPKDSNSSDLAQAEDSNEPAFKLEDHYTLSKLSKEAFITIVQNQSNPSVDGIKNLLSKEAQFIDMIFAMAPTDSNAPEMKPTVIEFKPDLSYYIIKSISLNQLWKENYQGMKSVLAYRKDFSESQSLALDYFNPANIVKRMNFRYPNEKKNVSDNDEVAEEE